MTSRPLLKWDKVTLTFYALLMLGISTDFFCHSGILATKKLIGIEQFDKVYLFESLDCLRFTNFAQKSCAKVGQENFFQVPPIQVYDRKKKTPFKMHLILSRNGYALKS